MTQILKLPSMGADDSAWEVYLMQMAADVGRLLDTQQDHLAQPLLSGLSIQVLPSERGGVDLRLARAQVLYFVGRVKDDPDALLEAITAGDRLERDTSFPDRQRHLGLLTAGLALAWLIATGSKGPNSVPSHDLIQRLDDATIEAASAGEHMLVYALSNASAGLEGAIVNATPTAATTP